MNIGSKERRFSDSVQHGGLRVDDDTASAEQDDFARALRQGPIEPEAN